VERLSRIRALGNTKTFIVWNARKWEGLFVYNVMNLYLSQNEDLGETFVIIISSATFGIIIWEVL